MKTLMGALALSALASACGGSSFESDTTKKETLAAHSGRVSGYLVVFEGDPLPTYDGSVSGFNATSRDATGGIKININSSDAQAYRSYLRVEQTDSVRDLRSRHGDMRVTRDFQLALNGIAVEMSEETAHRVALSEGVLAVYPDEIVYPTTASTIDFIGASRVHDGVATGTPFLGEGMVVGIIDTGINPRHPSFAATGDDGYTVQAPAAIQAGGYLGDCATVAGICNDKLVGVYGFVGDDPVNAVNGDPSSFDSDGHGSHVASTAAGNVVFNASVPDADGRPGAFSFSEVSGVAPHANIISYKVCARGCSVQAIVSAVEQGIADGVDVLNHSISSGGGSPWVSPQALAFLNARAAGIFVSNSAGNSGPAAGTAEASGNAPWAAAVAASTHDRAFTEKTVSFQGGDTPAPAELTGRSVSGGISGPVVYAGDYSNGVDETPEQCLVPFPAGTFNGEIVVCDRGQIARVAKGQNVRDGGAGGFILANLSDGANTVNDDPHVLPSIHVDAAGGDALRAWLATGTGHVATIGGLVSVTSDPNAADVVVGFSSRGPYTGFDLLAPNVAAPGSDIFAAGAGLSDAQLLFMRENFDERGQAGVPGAYGSISGTSMAAPHVAGTAALVKQAHPDWTDAEVLSAMQTTGTRNMLAVQPEGVSNASPFDRGVGRVQVDLAVRAGLVLDESPLDFFNANPAEGGVPSQLNVAALVDGSCQTRCTWTREVRATVSGVWTATSDVSWLDVSPVAFSLAPGQTQTVTVSADASRLVVGRFEFGEVLLQANDSSLPAQHLTVAARTLSDAPTVVETFSGDVEPEEDDRYGPFEVTPGSQFIVNMTGDGDADMYVRYGAEPTTDAFNCRPFLGGTEESCIVSIPPEVGTAYILVRGFEASNYNLEVIYAPAAPETQVTEVINGEVARGESVQFGPFAVVPGSPVIAEMSGKGDPDLLVRFDSAPSVQSYDCRPSRSGANEVCTLNASASQDEFYVGVYGYSSGTFTLKLTYQQR
ncbi:MAG: S8 family serine peptidase [Myxococcota bacterium]